MDNLIMSSSIGRFGSFCLCEDDLGITVSTSSTWSVPGGVQISGPSGPLISQATGTLLFPPGKHLMPAIGWYNWGLASYYPNDASASGTIAYTERNELLGVGGDAGLGLGGVTLPEMTDYVAEPVNKGRISLGVMQKRVILQGGVDDRLVITINGQALWGNAYGATKTLDLTQRVRDGGNVIHLSAIDNNNGKCWNVWYLIGDRFAWKHADSYANTTCGPNLPRQDRTMYTIEFDFSFQR